MNFSLPPTRVSAASARSVLRSLLTRPAGPLIHYLAQARTAGHGLADVCAERGDGAAAMSVERLLHLHGLENHHQVTRRHGLAIGHGDLDDGSLHGGGQ